MKILARFYVQAFTEKAGDTAEVNLQPVSSKENARWSQYTPAGSLVMQLTRKASGARSAFKGLVGKECLVTLDFDVEKAEAPEYVQGEGYVSDEA